MPPEPETQTPDVLFLIGVSGSGKTTIGERLASELEWLFLDADSLHPEENVEKMARGAPLTDLDRAPWLDAIESAVRRFLAKRQHAVIACSALKRRYRDQLAVDDTVRFVLLHGEPALLRERLERRQGHFMPARLLETQLADLELPDRHTLHVDIATPPADVVRQIRAAFGL